MRTISMLLLISMSLTAVVGDTVGYSQEQLKEYVGEYGQRYVKTNGHKLFIGFGDGPEIEMAATDKRDVFEIPSMNDEKVVFVRNEQGKVTALRKPDQSGDVIEIAKL